MMFKATSQKCARQWLSILAFLFATPAFANNLSQTTIDTTNCSGTIATLNTWQRVLATDVKRAQFLFQNVAATNIGIAFMPMSNNGVTPPYTGIGSAGVFTLIPFASYEPDGGWIDGGEFWVIGTASAAYSCKRF